MTDNTGPTIDTLRANILTEFKQVLKLSPADYTENCTNVVMSLVEEYVSDQVAKAKIDELNRIPRTNYGNDFAIHINAYLDDRIAELRSKE